MKSSIKVDYKSRFGDHFAEKEPIIRVIVEASDDPRDTLLGEILAKDIFCRHIGVNKLSENDNDSKQVYTIYRRSDREYKINDIADPILAALREYSGIKAELIITCENLYFQLLDNYNIRSKSFVVEDLVLNDYTPNSVEFSHQSKLKFIGRMVDDWKDFEKIVQEYKSKSKI